MIKAKEKKRMTAMQRSLIAIGVILSLVIVLAVAVFIVKNYIVNIVDAVKKI